MVSCHLKAGKHKRAGLHFAHTESRDAEYLPLESHLIGKQLGMTVVDVNTIATHSELDLVYDALPSSLNTEHSARFQYMIGRSVTEVDTRCPHHLAQAIALNQKIMLVFVFFLLADYSSYNRSIPLDDHMG